MENRQYSHEFQGLEKAVYREITPSILDVPPIRRGFDPIRKATGSRFGIALNLFLFKELEVEFSILENRFLRMRAYHNARKFADKMVGHKCVYYFFIPTFVDIDRIVVEWYNDHCAYIREGPLETLSAVPSNVFGPDGDEEEIEQQSSTEKESTAVEDPSKDVASRATEKDSDDALSAKESLTVECGSERDLAEVSIEEGSVPDDDIGIVKEVSSREGSTSEKGPQPEGSGKESSEEVGPSEKESQPGKDQTGEDEQSAESLESCTREIGKLFRRTDLSAAGKSLKPEYVDKNYKPDSDALDVERLLDDQRISIKSFQRNFFLA